MTSEDCAKPIWVNLAFTDRGQTLCMFSTGMHGLPRVGDTVEHTHLDDFYFGEVILVKWANTTEGTFKPIVCVEVSS